MIRAALALASLAGLSSSASAVDIVLVSGPLHPGPYAVFGDHPAVAATPDGFAVMWRDLESTGPGPNDVRGHLRFARYDMTAGRIADSGFLPFDIDAFTFFAGHELIASKNGFISFLQHDAEQLWTYPIGPDAQPTRDAAPIVTSIELELVSVAAGSGGKILITYPEWIGTWTDWAVPIGSDGLPSGPRHNVVPGTGSQDLLYRFMNDSPLAPIPSGFFTAWVEGKVGIRVRNLDFTGAPAGPIELALPDASCPVEVAAATVGGTEVVVYSAGCAQSDVFFRTRAPGGALGPSMTIADEPGSEGGPVGDFLRDLRAVGGDTTFGVLYTIVIPLSGGGSTLDWVFAQFDVAGRLVGSRTMLDADMGIIPYDAIDLVWDPYHHRFLLAWSGYGPLGGGVYVMGIPARS